MSTTANNTVYVEPEDNSIGEQITHTDREGRVIERGNLIYDDSRNSLLAVVGVHNESIDCFTDKFEVCSINKNWIGEYSIVGKFDVDGFLEFIKEAQYDE